MDNIAVLKRPLGQLRSEIGPHTHEVLPVGHKRHLNSRALPCPISFDYNYPFTVRDGTVLRADVYRPADAEGPFPAIIMWSPYGKSTSGAFTLNFAPLRVGVKESALSGYESFEGLDPAEWVPRGYAVINVDSRGAGQSDGSIHWWGRGEAQDGHDVVEAVAAQPWCSSRVALAGNSWLAMSQWFIASAQPPHLTCIAPLEGQADVYRESLYRGGVPSLAFPALAAMMLSGPQEQEDVVAMAKRYPKMNAYWADKRANMSKINIPAYIGGSYSTNLHTMGSFRGFEEIPHDKKWLVVHDTQEWHDLYSDKRSHDLARFFDFYMKDIQNGWEHTPRVRQALLGFNIPNEVYTAQQLPWLASNGAASKLKLYLSADGTMAQPPPPSTPTTTLSYQSDVQAMQVDNDPGELSFTYTFATRTVLAGPSKAVLHMSSDPQHSRGDLDVWVQLRKADHTGRVLRSLNIPLADLGECGLGTSKTDHDVPDTSTLKHLGPAGVLRASARKVDQNLSPPHWDTLSHRNEDTILPLAPGEVVKMEIGMWPTGIVFEAGEKLVLKVAGHDMRLVDVEKLQGTQKTENVGEHFVHFGGQEGLQNFVEVFIVA